MRAAPCPTRPTARWPRVVRRSPCRAPCLDALLEGFAWDAAGRRYDTLDDLLDYAARVAGAVGAMMAVLMGVRDPALLARACDLGVAMQLTNIARDVGEDARAGRLYLPLAWLREAGIDPDAFLADPALQSRFGRCGARGCWPRRTRCTGVPIPASRRCRGIAGPASSRRGCCMRGSGRRWRATATTRSPGAPPWGAGVS